MDCSRVNKWDNLKCLLILLVVIGHFADIFKADTFKSIYLFIYSFHMPLFIFISGLFHKNKNILEKVLSYFSIYVVFKIVLFAVRSLINGKAVTFKLFTEDGAPWYMFAFAVFIATTYLLRNINKKFLLAASLFIACFAGYDTSIGDYFMLSRIIVFYPFYLLGTMVSREKLEAFARGKTKAVISAAVICAWAAICVFCIDNVYMLRPLFTGRNHFPEEIYNFGFLYRLLTYAMSLIFGLALICLTPNKRFPLVTETGRRTLQIYFWHLPILFIIAGFGVADSLCPTPLGKLIWLFMGVALTYLTSLKCFSFPTQTILKCRKKLPNDGNSGF